MKKKCLIVLISIISFSASFSQTDLSFSYNSVHVGRNVEINIKQNFKKKHSLIIGAKYHINSIIYDNQGNVFKKRFYATSFKEHWGFTLGYQRNFFFKKTDFTPFIFYDFQFTNSHTHNKMYIPYTYAEDGRVLYDREIVIFGPTIALENNIGIGMEQKIFNNFYLYEKAGMGMVYYTNIDNRLRGGYTFDFDWEFCHILSIGLIYRFGKK